VDKKQPNAWWQIKVKQESAPGWRIIERAEPYGSSDELPRSSTTRSTSACADNESQARKI